MRIGEIHHQTGIGLAGDIANLLAVHQCHRLDPEGVGKIIGGDGKAEHPGIHIRRDFQAVNANLRHGLKPDGLPDAGTGRIKNPFRLARLFAPGLVAFGRVGHAQG